MNEQQETICEIMADELCVDADELKTNSRLEQDLGADSLDRLNLTMRLEDEFGFQVPDEDAEKIQTVQDVFNYVAKHAK